MRLLLIRHGQTTNNVSGALDTAIPGAELTPLGQAQADAVPAALAAEPVAALYASRLVRTQLTAMPLGRERDLEVVVQPGLEEISAGDLELRTDPPAREVYIACLSAWMRGDLTRTMPGGPDGHAFLDRFDTALGRISAQHGPDETVAVVSHGAAIRVFTGLRAGLDPDDAEELRLLNTGMAALRRDASGWSLESWRTEPLGGIALEDPAAIDPTGESETSVHDRR